MEYRRRNIEMETILTKANFKEVMSCGKPVLVDFWAAWCGPCRMLAPTVEQIAEEYDGRVEVCKCDVDDQDELAVTFGIRSIPTLLFFKDGNVVDRSVGLVSKQEIVSRLGKLI